MCCQLLHTIELVPNSCSVQCNNNKCSLVCFHFAHFLFSALLIAPMYFIPSSFAKIMEATRQSASHSALLRLPNNIYNRKYIAFTNDADIADRIALFRSLQRNVDACELGHKTWNFYQENRIFRGVRIIEIQNPKW